ncbi:MAG TPA: glycosyltransferase, partial [Chitinophagaceae bacterium]|nr:glycosyltransferase [Chitinophagaceae bacterium]
VYQRPQHLMSRFRKYHRVFIVEEPIYDAPSPYNVVHEDRQSGVSVVVPHLPQEAAGDVEAQRALLDLFIQSKDIKNFIAWYYSPLALAFSSHLEPAVTIYDCMDELSGFKFASPSLKYFEDLLFEKADIVFTGGYHLYEAKKNKHHNIHAFPSSIDKSHFERARLIEQQPEDQAMIPGPRIGFYGVIDERLDIALLADLAGIKPQYHFILIGPVVKIDPDTLPRRDNIHYLGQKSYKELPEYLGGWDMAMMPFARNEATEFISPTKTPEFLAAGKPVVSTAIHDVVKPYGELELVAIADTAPEFAEAIESSLQNKNDSGRLEKVDAFLGNISWNNTWQGMAQLIGLALEKKKLITDTKNKGTYV